MKPRWIHVYIYLERREEDTGGEKEAHRRENTNDRAAGGGKSIRGIHGHCQDSTVSRLFRGVRARASVKWEPFMHSMYVVPALPFFFPAHILINGSFLRKCNVRETKSRRHDRESFYRFLCLLSKPCMAPRSCRTRVRASAPVYECLCVSFHVKVTFLHYAFLHRPRRCSMLRPYILRFPLGSLCILRKWLLRYLLKVSGNERNSINFISFALGWYENFQRFLVFEDPHYFILCMKY